MDARREAAAVRRRRRVQQNTEVAAMSHRFVNATVLTAASLLACSAVAGGQSKLPLKYKGKPTEPAITAADAMTRLYVLLTTP